MDTRDVLQTHLKRKEIIYNMRIYTFNRSMSADTNENFNSTPDMIRMIHWER